ncbi:hypothetical protein ELI49_23660 [Rhizobium ruizarguesonis]|uniref:hypothetical protein n=2 Tax=Rhizobium TaxID=379 RepID=UPI00102FDBD4|nr:hypothetical protein [Rhizobium ruizarguesonis]NEJ06566.1 hypothetical protein [Rhizobium ruizarguesonis]QIJ43063.1 hypothetical protein G7039_24210 [Rhizobium leguminosarum]TAU12541.1 hypothetical protein ELI49_23660 [Rhizobium ruizarguesonis]
MVENFEYDVAFSFAAQDEAIATELNDLLSDRLKTFIYSERQKEIAGRDGQEAFSEVYAQKARLVVVLYRETWGQTPWTRVEMGAIKNRSLQDGWDFTVFIPTEAKRTMPAWVPKTRLYVDLERWGSQGAAAVIEARATELGANFREETFVDRAARHQRSEALKELQEQFLRSDKGVNAARAAFKTVKSTIAERAVEMPNLGIKFVDKGDFAIVSGARGVHLIISWSPQYSNSIENVYLEAKYFKGFPKMPGFYASFEKAVLKKSVKIPYLLVREGATSYVDSTGGTKREMTSEKLADDLLYTLLGVIERERE